MSSAETQQVFSDRTAAVLVIVAAGTLCFGMFLGVFGGEIFDAPSAGTDSFSRSAIGHHAFAVLLERAGISVHKSRRDSAGKVNNAGLLIIAEPAEPDTPANRNSVFQQLIRRDVPTLLVLPKYDGDPSPGQPGHVERVSWRHPDLVAQLTSSILPADVRIFRPGVLELGEWRLDTLDVSPSLPAPQLLIGDLVPVLECDAGVLLASVVGLARDAPLWVLSDPDLLANHAIGRQRNAELMLAIVEQLRRPDGNVVFDEVVHGHGVIPSIWRELMSFPLSLVSIHIVLILAVLLWSQLPRFGAAVAPAPPLGAGKAALVQNIAELLLLAGNTASAARTAGQSVRRQICGAFHLRPAPEADLQVETRLSELSDLRGAAASYHNTRELRRQLAVHGASRHAALKAAQAAYRWKQEILRGTH
jgi:hypothetical protein